MALSLLFLLATLVSGTSFYINGPTQALFGVALSFQVTSFPLDCATTPRVRVTSPLGVQVPFEQAACSNGITLIQWTSCEEGPHVVAVLNEQNQQIAALQVLVLPRPTKVVSEPGPAQSVVFEFDGLVPQTQ